MKFIFASLLCAVVSAAPLAQDKQKTSGAGVEGLNKALESTANTIKNIGLGGVGGAKRGLDEHLEARQTGDVVVRLDQPAVDLSLGDDNGQVEKRQTLTSLLAPLLGGKAGGKKRDGMQDDVSAILHTAEHAVPDPNTLKAGIEAGRGKYQVD